MLAEFLARGSAGQEITKNHSPLESQIVLVYLGCVIHILIDGQSVSEARKRNFTQSEPPWRTFTLSENVVTFVTSANLKQMAVDLRTKCALFRHEIR